MTRMHLIDNDRLRRVAPAKLSRRSAAPTPGGTRGSSGAVPPGRVVLGLTGLLAWAAAIGAGAGTGVASAGAPAAQRSDDGPIRRFAALWLSWRERRAERRYLQRINDHLLDDIGLLRRDVEHDGRPGRFGA